MGDSASNEGNYAHKERLLRSLKKEVKHIMEESVMLKTVHEDSASVTSLCSNVDSCLSLGLKRRALGLFKTSSTTALIQKVAKEFDEAGYIMKQVTVLEQAAGQKRAHSTGDSTGSLSKGSRSGLMEKTQSGSNLAAFTPRFLWIRVALFEKRLQKIVAYLVQESDRYYTKESLVADQDFGPILSSLLVGPCALEYTKVKASGSIWTDLPANELVQRHKISSCGSSSSISSPPSGGLLPRVELQDSTSGSESSPGVISLSLSPLHHVGQYRRSLSTQTATDIQTNSFGFDEKRSVPSQAREYVESLHQNQKDTLIYGKNNVMVHPKNGDILLAGYLSLHQISSGGLPTSLALKWTPNQLMNGPTIEDKNASWQQALYIELDSILFLHCHQDGQEPGTLVLISSDGTQNPPLQFPPGGHMVQFLACIETSLASLSGRLDPSLKTAKADLKKATNGEGSASADAAKSKRKFPWIRKEAPLQETDDESFLEGNLDWVFKVILDTEQVQGQATPLPQHTTATRSTSLFTTSVPPAAATLAAPSIIPLNTTSKGGKISGSREWLANLFSPSKSRNSSSSTDTTASRSQSLSEYSAVEASESKEEVIAVQIEKAADLTNKDEEDAKDAEVECIEEINEQQDNGELEPLGQEVSSGSRTKTPTEPISTLCSSMRRQIISRAFYGWLAHCRHLKTVRKHLGGLAFHEDFAIPEDSTWQEGVTSSWWKAARPEEDNMVFEREFHMRTYLGGIEPDLRPKVWPFLLGHYKWIHTASQRADVDKRVRTMYEHKLSDWMAIEAIVRQKDKETTAANIAKLSGGTSLEQVAMNGNHSINISNEVFESTEEDHCMSSRTVSADKISTITEATENSTSNSEKSRSKLLSTQSDPPLPSSGDVVKPNRPSTFRENLASDEGIDESPAAGVNASTNNESDTSDTEGEDIDVSLVSEEDQQKVEAANGLDTNRPATGEVKGIPGPAVSSQAGSKCVSYRITTPSVDSGNPSECSPLKVEMEGDDDVLGTDDHLENYERDLSQITQKIATLAHPNLTPPVTRDDTISSASSCHSPASSEGGIYAQELIDNFALNLHRIDKDVQRCDRNHPYFTLPNLDKLRNIITTYVWENLDVGYMQGMCDLVAPLLVVFNDEALTHSCFSHLMERMLCNFPHGSQMDENFANMRSLIQVLDQNLYDTIQKNGDFSHFYFCYRWFLLDFKREFAYSDIFLIWETIWASRKVVSSHFFLFVALALVENYRDIILDRNMDFTDIIKFFNEMAEKHDGKQILLIARELVHQLQTIIVDK